MAGAIYRFYKQQGVLLKLILINVFVFVVVSILDVIFKLSGHSDNIYISLHTAIALPASFSLFILKPWTIISYMFVHSTENIFHILFNMLMLFWFGRIFLEFQKEKKIVWLYIFGGISGGLFFMLAYTFIPVLAENRPPLGLVGASASVIAILIATAVLVPDYGVGLLLIGRVKLKYIALFLVVVDVISLSGSNSGGHFAHLGGAVYGLLYTMHIRGLIGITERIELLFNRWKRNSRRDGIRNLRYKPVNEKREAKKESRRMAEDQEIIDRILDKISRSGYDSLTEEEKNCLFNASKK